MAACNQTVLDGRVIAPNYVRVFAAYGIDAGAAENAFAVGVQAVNAAGDGLVAYTRSLPWVDGTQAFFVPDSHGSTVAASDQRFGQMTGQMNGFAEEDFSVPIPSMQVNAVLRS